MAEERRARTPGSQEERGSDVAPAPAPKSAKKKKKLGKIGMLFILLLLTFGAGTGLHFSGIWDARPLVWEVVPQIPYIGKPVADFFRIPEQYSLTVDERRTYEQNERQKRLDERERNLIDRETVVEAALADVTVRSQRLSDQEMTAKDDNARKTEDAASAAEKNLIAQRIKDFNTMSARNSAQIVEEMSDQLAVKILQGLNSDARASILGKMDAKKAARLVELMSIN